MKAIPRSINVTDACSVASEISNIGAVPPMTRRNSSKMLQEELQAQQTVLNPNLNDDIYASYVREKERKKVLAERNAREHRKSRIKKENGAKSISSVSRKSVISRELKLEKQSSDSHRSSQSCKSMKAPSRTSLSSVVTPSKSHLEPQKKKKTRRSVDESKSTQKSVHSKGSAISTKENDDIASCVRVHFLTSVPPSIRTIELSKTRILKREREMERIAKKSQVAKSRWNGSLLYCKCNEQIWKMRSSPNKAAVIEIEMELPLELQKDWTEYMTSMIKDYYDDGVVRVSTDCTGKDVLLALEHFGIVYSPSQVLYNDFSSYMRVSMWCDYFSHRDALANFIIHKCVIRFKRAHAFFTSPDLLDPTDYHSVRGKRCEVFDGGLVLGDPTDLSCSVVHDYFFDGDEDGDGDTGPQSFATKAREDFCSYLMKYLPGTTVHFEVCPVRPGRSSNPSGTQTSQRAVLFVKCGHTKKVDNSLDESLSASPVSQVSFEAKKLDNSLDESLSASPVSQTYKLKKVSESSDSSPSKERPHSEWEMSTDDEKTAMITPEKKLKSTQGKALTPWLVDNAPSDPLDAILNLLESLDVVGSLIPDESEEVVDDTELEAKREAPKRNSRKAAKYQLQQPKIISRTELPNNKEQKTTLHPFHEPSISNRTSIEELNSGWLRDMFSLKGVFSSSNTRASPPATHPLRSPQLLHTSCPPPPPSRDSISQSCKSSTKCASSGLVDECGIEVRPRSLTKTSSFATTK